MLKCVSSQNSKEAKVVTLTGNVEDTKGEPTCNADSCHAVAAPVFAVGGKNLPNESAGSDVVLATESEVAAS